MSPFISLRFLQTQTDARLLTLAAEGHERAFEALVRRHRRGLLAYGRRLLGSSSRAEDAVQQALLQAWIALQHGTEVRDAKSWFYRIVRNAALNMQRGAAGQEFAELNNASKADGAGDIDGWMDIRDVFTELAALPPLQRQALLRTSLDGESHDEVASALGVTTKAVRGLVYRARATMRAAVSALIPPPLVHWALSGKSGVGGSDRIAEVVAGGSGISVGAIALNSGAAMVTVSALAVGVAVAPHGHRARPQRHSRTRLPRPPQPLRSPARRRAAGPSCSRARRTRGTARRPSRDGWMWRKAPSGRPADVARRAPGVTDQADRADAAARAGGPVSVPGPTRATRARAQATVRARSPARRAARGTVRVRVRVRATVTVSPGRVAETRADPGPTSKARLPAASGARSGTMGRAGRLDGGSGSPGGGGDGGGSGSIGSRTVAAERLPRPWPPARRATAARSRATETPNVDHGGGRL